LAFKISSVNSLVFIAMRESPSSIKKRSFNMTTRLELRCKLM
jgi:hypothetical protein